MYPDPITEQTFPIVQGENSVCEDVENGFIRYSAFASHVDEERGQHWSPEEHRLPLQSCKAPKV